MNNANPTTNSTDFQIRIFKRLAEAIEKNSIIDVEEILKAGADINCIGNPALMRSNSNEMTALLLKAGADVNAKSIYGATALMKTKSGEMTKLLLRAGADVNAKEILGRTALMFAKTSEITLLLLEAGADVNAKDEYGVTALMRSKSSETTSLLLEAGADVNAKNEHGITVLMCDRTIEIVSLLLKAGADINAKDMYGRTALMFTKNIKIVSLFIEAGASDYINAKDNDGKTALMYSGLSETTTLLLEAGADVNAQTSDGETALGFAISAGNEKKIRTLLAHGADMPIKPKYIEEILYCHKPSLLILTLASGINAEKKDIDYVIQRCIKTPPPEKKEMVALLLAAGASRPSDLPSELEPTPQDLAGAGERLRSVQAELAAERSLASLRAIRGRAAQVCIALQGLELPALVTLHILEELDEKARSVRMGALWALITAVKHSRLQA